MKNFLLPLNIILLIAVGILFYFQFSKRTAGTAAAHKCENSANCTNARVAYFDLDSLDSRYEYAKEVKQTLEAKEKNMRGSLNQLQQQYVNLMKEYQQRGPSLSQTEQSEYQQRLMRLQTEYQQKEQDFSQDLQSETMRRLMLLKTKIQEVLKDYSKQHGYSFIMATSENDNLMYHKDTAFNITNDVIKVLNEAHKKTKE